MGLTPINNDVILRMVELRKQRMSCREIAKIVGCHPATVAKKLKTYAENNGSITMDIEPGAAPPTTDRVMNRVDLDGTIEVVTQDRPPSPEEMLDLCQLDRTKWIPQNYRGNLWQGFYKVKDGDGHRKVNLVQSRISCKRIITEELEHAILEFVRENVTAIPCTHYQTTSSISEADTQMLCWGLWDAHIGSYAWNSEVGADWDVDIACHRIFQSVDDIVSEAKLYPISRVLMPIGNDFLHFDSVRATTAMGDHYLDVDTRFARVYLAGLKCLSYMVERAVEIAGHVEIIYVPGNHDTSSSFTLCAALAQRYRNDPRILVDLSANPRKYRSHGGTLIGFDHGTVKPERLAMNLATEARDLWGNSTYREVQIGHKHQRRERMFEGVVPTNGILVRTNPSLCNVDIWSHRQGMTGEPMKSVEGWRYDTLGYRGSHVSWACPETTKHELASKFITAMKCGKLGKDIV